MRHTPIVAFVLVAGIASAILVGCGSSAAEPKATAEKSKAKNKKQTPESKPKKPAETPATKPDPEIAKVPPDKPSNEPTKQPPGRLPEGPKLSELVGKAGVGGDSTDFDKAAIPIPAPPPIDEDKAQAHGIRKVSGKLLTLYTD